MARVLLAGHYSYRSCGCLLFTLSSLIATSSLVEIFVPTRIEKPGALLNACLLHSQTADVPGFPRRTRSNKHGAEGHTEKDVTERTRPDLATEPVLVTHTKLHSSQEDRSHCHALASSKLSPDRQLPQISCCSCSYLDLPWEPSAGPAMQVQGPMCQIQAG